MKKLPYSDLSIKIDIPNLDYKVMKWSIDYIDLAIQEPRDITIDPNQILYERQLKYYKYSSHIIKLLLLNDPSPWRFEGIGLGTFDESGYYSGATYTYDMYKFFHQAPIFILLFHHIIPYSLKEIWEDFQESGNYHRKPRIDPEFRSNYSSPDILLRYQ
jgi:hypothetical protein